MEKEGKIEKLSVIIQKAAFKLAILVIGDP